MKTRKSAGIELRLKSTKAREFFKHQENAKKIGLDLPHGRSTRSIENETGLPV